MLIQGQGWTAFRPAGTPERAEDSKREPQPVFEAFDKVKIASSGRALTLKVIHFNTASKVVKIAQSLDRGSELFGL